MKHKSYSNKGINCIGIKFECMKTIFNVFQLKKNSIANYTHEIKVLKYLNNLEITFAIYL